MSIFTKSWHSDILSNEGSWEPAEVPTRMSVVVVLTWDGEVSAVSRDAVQDSRLARTATVIDDWDEEVDRGKVQCAARAGPSELGRGPGQGVLDLSGPD